MALELQIVIEDGIPCSIMAVLLLMVATFNMATGVEILYVNGF